MPLIKTFIFLGPSLLNKSPIPMHNQTGSIRTNHPLQRFSVPVNNPFFPDYTPTVVCILIIIIDVIICKALHYNNIL